MALPDILRNIGKALDRVERFVDGDRSINPKNTLNGIRISITTIQEHMQRHVQDAINSQDLLNTANRQINDIVNTRNELLRRDQMMEQAWKDERQARQQRDDEINNLRDAVCENVYEKCWWKRRHTACAQQAQNLKRYYRQAQADIGLLEYNRDRVYNRYEKWKAKEINSRQIILNLQNNPPGNMVTVQDVTISLAPLIAQIPHYTGQEPPDDYYNRMIQQFTYDTALGVVGFNDAVKTQILSSKMTGKFIPPDPFQHPAGTNVVTPALFLAWLRHKYREVMVGSSQASMRALMNEKFLPIDTTDSYEKRVRPYVQDIPYADAQSILYNHLPENLALRVQIANPVDLNAFFTELKRKWLEVGGTSISAQAIQQIPGPTQTLAIQPQKDSLNEGLKAIAFMKRLAGDLQYTGLASDVDILDNFIYDDLGKRFERKTNHNRRSLFAEPQVRNTNTTKKAV